MLVIGVFLPVASSLTAPDITMTADIKPVKPGPMSGSLRLRLQYY